MFAEKFSLLNSQEHSDEIHWSSSSDELGNKSCDDKTQCAQYRRQLRKRKRRTKVIRNTSNLDINILPASKNNTIGKHEPKSPILVGKRVCKSPILSSSHLSPVKKTITTSPILNKTVLLHKSPILTLKYSSPKSGKFKKKLFSKPRDRENNKSVNIDGYCDINYRDSGTRHNMCAMVPSVLKYNSQDNKQYGRAQQIYDCSVTIPESSSITITADDESMCNEKLNIIKKFFDHSNNSSDNTSQHISDSPTPNDSSKSDEIDILSFKTQSGDHVIKQETLHSDSTNLGSKKIRYKKGGLAYRLNVLLKKHNANICLWQHERYLAKNSNFVMPKSEHCVFYIQNSLFKYDNYLLDVSDVNNTKYMILINNLYVMCNIKADCAIKLYEPYKIIDFNQYCKLIMNVCKFEIVDIKV